MSPPCPNCGTIYSEGPIDNQGWRKVSISTWVIIDAGGAGKPGFYGEEHQCQKCGHRWRVAFPRPTGHLEAKD